MFKPLVDYEDSLPRRKFNPWDIPGPTGDYSRGSSSVIEDVAIAISARDLLSLNAVPICHEGGQWYILCSNPVSQTPSPQDLNTLKELAEMYQLDDKEQVMGYLHQHGFLMRLLKVARTRLNEAFPGAEVHLRVVRDPEIPSFDHLGAFIRVDVDPEDAYQRFTEIESEWLLDLFAEAKRKLLIDMEFV